MYMQHLLFCLFFFFFNDTATTEIYTLSLHDALPIYNVDNAALEPELLTSILSDQLENRRPVTLDQVPQSQLRRSEEHTSELQSHSDLVCRLLLEKKKKKSNNIYNLEHDYDNSV